MFALQQRLPRYALTSGLALLTLVMLSAPVAAQRFKSIKPKMGIRAAKALGGAVNNAMRNPDGNAEKVIKQYFRTFYFPMMTQTGTNDLARLGRLREDLFKRYLRSNQTKKSSQDFLTSETLTVMKVIVRDNYHPAVRFNAVLIIGLLDEEYASDSPPVPLPAATNELLELLEQEEFNKVKVPPQVKVGALQGLERHVRYGVDPQYSERITKAAMAVLTQKAESMDISAEINDWMKCQAAGVLIRQTKDNPNAEVQAALTKLIANEEIGLDDRCHVVDLLKSMNYKKAAGAGLDLTTAVLPLGNLTQAVVDEGAKEATEYIDEVIGKNPRAGRGGFGRGGRGQQGPKLERSHLLAQIKSIDAGAKSLADGLPDAEKQKLDELMTTLDPIVALSSNKKSIDVEVAEKIVDLKSTIDTMIASWQPAAAEAADEVDFTE